MLLPLLLGLVATARAGVRMDCYPEPGADQGKCEARGCTWQPADQTDDKVEPWCFFKNGIGYKYASSAGNTITLVKNNGPKNPWGTDAATLALTTTNIGAVLNIRITDGQQRWEPPIDLPRENSTSSDGVVFNTNNIAADPFAFTVTRKSTMRKLFDTSLGGLIFSDKFIQIATYLPSENMYGWGENIHQTLKHDFSKYLVWGMFARDEPPDSGSLDTKNLYGVHPFYMVIEPDGKVHGVLILNSNAQEVITTPGPALIYRTIGGILDIYFFPGPDPASVIQQYQALIGRPALPAYWGLGYQLSRYGYTGLAQVQSVISKIRNLGIPLDTAVVDIDYMDRYKDFTIGQQNWAGLPDYAKQLHSWGMRLIPIWDPAIEVDYPVFQRAINQSARFIEWERQDQVMQNIQSLYPMAANTKIMLGVVWPDNHVAFPDFFDNTNATQNWWIQEFTNFYNQLNYDGIWIDMNEPSNFGTNDDHPWYYDSSDHPDDLPLKCPSTDGGTDAEWDMPPYKTYNVWVYGQSSYLATKTLCLEAVQNNGNMRFYNSKNLYGWSESKYTQEALHQATGRRGVVISRSTFPSSGRYAGHWLGDNTARWEDLRTSVIGAQEFNLFGIPYVGSDICGFIGTTTEELCLRWQQMGAFHSFMRNHNNNGSPAQDPSVWPSVANATRKANLFRYRYMPYLYTLHHLASATGGTVVRPVWFEFPHDSTTYNLNYQFMWGNAMLIAPVVYQGATDVTLYLPEGPFYSLFDYLYGQPFGAGEITVPAPTTSQIPVFARAGFIIPRQTPNVTTAATRSQPFELLIVPASGALGNLTFASGKLRWDDGESVVPPNLSHADYWDINYSYQGTPLSGNLTITVDKKDSSVSLPTLDVIEIFNYNYQPNTRSFLIDGKSVPVNSQCTQYSAITKILKICATKFFTFTGSSQTISWSNTATLDLDKKNYYYAREFYRFA